MAVVGEIRVRSASRNDWEALDELVSVAIEAMGGPPTGLMVNMGRPVGDGFVVTSVWRTDSELRQFHQAVLVPAFAEAGLEADDLAVGPIWGLARP